MSVAYVVVTLLAAAMVAYSAGAVFAKVASFTKSLDDYGVPRRWWPWLGVAKATGAAGLLVGLFVPAVGVAAAVGLVLYFTGAVVTVVRAKWYPHVAFPLVYMAPVATSFAFGLAA